MSPETDNFEFLDQINQNRVFLIYKKKKKKKKKKNHHRILHIRISLVSKALKQTILILEINFPEKGYVRSKTEKMNITTELSIFELVYVTTFSLN